MATKTSLLIETQESGENKRQITVTNVSASATDQQLYSFISAYAALSLNTPVGYVKVTRKDLEASNNG